MAKRFDPMEPWKGVRTSTWMRWGKTMVDMVNSEAYAQANGSGTRHLSNGFRAFPRSGRKSHAQDARATGNAVAGRCGLDRRT